MAFSSFSVIICKNFDNMYKPIMHNLALPQTTNLRHTNKQNPFSNAAKQKVVGRRVFQCVGVFIYFATTALRFVRKGWRKKPNSSSSGGGIDSGIRRRLDTVEPHTSRVWTVADDIDYQYPDLPIEYLRYRANVGSLSNHFLILLFLAFVVHQHHHCKQCFT